MLKTEDVIRKVDILLAEKGLTQGEVSNKMGLSKQAMSEFRKTKRLTMLTVGKLAKALDVPVAHFFD